MAEYKGITAEMTATVDRLIATDFKDATPDEIKAYAEFQKIMALNSEASKQKRELRERESKARQNLFEQQAQSAMDALDALTELAKAKLKAVENGI